MPTIILLSAGGLGNKLRPILSALSICENLPNYSVRILWIRDTHSDIDLEDIFKDNNMLMNLNDVGKLKPFLAINKLNIKGKQLFELPQKKHVWEYVLKSENNSGMFDSKNIIKIEEILNNKKNLLIDTCYLMGTRYENQKSFPKIFSNIIKDDLKCMIKHSISEKNLNKDIIGVHLRATDVENITKKKLDTIINIITKNSNQKYFVCTDSLDYHRKVENYAHIISNAKSEKEDVKLNSNKKPIRTKESIINAMIDLGCLSVCNLSNLKLIGWTGSSFYDIATKIKNWEKY